MSSNIYIFISFIYSSVEGHLGCFHILAIINNAAMNIGVRASFQISVFIFFGCISISGIAGSYSSSIFSFSRNLHTGKCTLNRGGLFTIHLWLEWNFQSENASQGRSKRSALGEDLFWGQLDPAAPALSTSPREDASGRRM